MLEAFDREQWCPVLQARFEAPDIGVLRTLLGPACDDDPDLNRSYDLDEAEVASVASAFGVAFDPSRLDVTDRELSLYRWRRAYAVPYLVHTGYELPLLLDGRKKLARMSHGYPPREFPGEDRFDHWVAAGLLHKEEVLEPFPEEEPPSRDWLGHRTVYYTLKGEEWRIPAMALVWKAAGKSGGWNEHFERLEGMLFGYEDWQNDWWIENGLKAGGFGGLILCCAVNEAGLAWLEATGFRALPPTDKPRLMVTYPDPRTADEQRALALMLADKESVALVNFAVRAIAFGKLTDHADGPPWHLPGERIPRLNQLLLRPVVVRQRRVDGGWSDSI